LARPAIGIVIGLLVIAFEMIEHAKILNRMHFAGDQQRHAARDRAAGSIAGE
jgi:hypothetical protein